ncbi:MAG: pyridoxamine 5'-phosphate oxidase [Cyanobacteria bacterium DS2.3.42]|nr:pyridoxamine 5'-phosphate oxidase [Cyanobacteria bacterium DS2.3.42]
MSKYHKGERAVQQLAGVTHQADRLSGMFLNDLPDPAQRYLEESRFAAMTWFDDKQRIWITPLSGDPGFVQALDDQTIEFNFEHASAPLVKHHNFDHSPVALVAMDFVGRRRMRINGTAQSAGSLTISINQVYGNCPKHIQKRLPESEFSRDVAESSETDKVFESEFLSPALQNLVNRADTFFIGTYASEGGADASHRGGSPGFVKADAHTIRWTDFPGNNMFNTLGNIHSNRDAALLFVDFETGEGLAVSGTIETFTPSVEGKAAVKETVFKVQSAKYLPRALAQSWTLVEYSPFNNSL